MYTDCLEYTDMDSGSMNALLTCIGAVIAFGNEEE